MGVILERKKRILLNEPHLVTTTPAGIANFSTDLIAPLKSCKVEFSPVQSGSGDPSPDNVRPISGWTGCNVWRTGKNIWNAGDQTVYEYKVTAVNIPAGTYRLSTMLSMTAASNLNAAILFKKNADGSGATLGSVSVPRSNGTSRTSASFTITGEVKSVAMYAANAWTESQGQTATYTDIQIELGSTATPYTPYVGSTIPIDWTTEAGTVYGGYVNLVSGELVATYGYASISTASRSEDETGYFWYSTRSALSIPLIKTTNSGLIIDRFKKNANTTKADPDGVFTYYANGILRWKEKGSLSLSEYSAYIASNPIHLAYELATPITYQLTPTQLKSLRGVNNIWSDANGDTTVKYWTH